MIDKELLINCIKSSNTITETMKKMGISVRGKNYNTIKKYISIYQIDISHFIPHTSKSNYSKTISLKDALVENSNYSTGNLKKKLYKEKIKERKCELCGQDENWNGFNMSLILDHINGICNDHRIENLRIVCPNCNATLSTHCGKNKKRKITHFCLCGNVKLKSSKTCKDCKNKKSRKVLRPEKNVILEDIKNLGYKRTGQKYGVVGNSIRNWIK